MKYDIDKSIFGDDIMLTNYEVLSDTTTNDRVYELDVNFKSFSNTPVNTGITFINGDRNTSIIKAKMLMDKTLIDLKGITPTINLKEGINGHDIYTIVCDNVDTVNGIVTVNLQPYTVDLAGFNTFEFVLTKGEKVLVSQRYTYEVKESIGEGYIGESEQETALQTLIRKTQFLIDQLTIDVTDKDIQEIMSMIK